MTFKMKKLFFILFIFLAFVSCRKKDYPVPPSSNSATPVFYFNGKINNASVNLQAGVNNYFMFTSYALDGNGVYEFTGELEDKNCSANCTNDLKIKIRDYRQYSPMPTTIDSSLILGFYSYATPAGNASQYSATFGSNMQNGTVQTWNWNFGDGTVSNIQSQTAIHNYFHPGTYTVSLTATSTSSCASSLANDVAIGQTGFVMPATFSLTVSGTTVNFTSTVSGVTPITYNWNFGDGNNSSLQNPSHTYSSAGVYLVTLTATDNVNHTRVVHQNVSTQSASACSENFFFYTATPVSNPMNLADVIIEWRDASGILWTSQDNSQSSSSFFKILSVDNYANNSSGQKTKKIHAIANCYLYNGTNNIPFENADIVFSVAYP
jgi:PKD repeat protein